MGNDCGKMYFAMNKFVPETKCKTGADVMKFCKEKDVKFVDFKFTDLLGTWQHFTIPMGEMSEDIFKDGLGFDGSSIRGWRAIDSSDMLVIPDPATAMIDPFNETTTLSIITDIEDPITREPYDRDPRKIAKKAEAYLKSTGIADTCFMGPEAEFFVFDDVRCDYNQNAGFFFIDSNEAAWNSGKDEMPNLGYKIRNKEGYFPVSPADTQQDLRNDMSDVMGRCGLTVERQHHEVATAGQAEIDIRFNSLVNVADDQMLFKYIVKNVAYQNGKTATFMPKPIFGDNGSGMHVHQSLWKDGKPLFAGDKYAHLSEMALYYIGGVLKHARALAAFTNPTTNSYKRLVPGYEAPVNLAYSSRNRSASIRIPMYSKSPKAIRIEVRFPDPSANPYLAFTAMLMAGLDGILNKIQPGQSMDKNIYDLPPEELAKIPTMPGSLDEALECLEADHDFLLKGDVFSKEFIENWISYKQKDIDSLRLRPHPMEYMLYYDV